MDYSLQIPNNRIWKKFFKTENKQTNYVYDYITSSCDSEICISEMPETCQMTGFNICILLSSHWVLTFDFNSVNEKQWNILLFSVRTQTRADLLFYVKHMSDKHKETESS